MSDPQRRPWSIAKARLTDSVTALGYPEELADVMAKQLGSPAAMDRMSAYLERVQPRSMEMLVDEMLAICADAESWRKKKESREAQAGYNAWLNSDTRWRNLEEDE